MGRLEIGVIGCGYWGPNLVRTFIELPGASVRAVADLDHARLEEVGRRHPQIERLTTDHTRLFDMGLDAVVVSTPPETHYEIVRACLEQGLDVLVEKPLAIDTESARALAELAAKTERILMVGHIGAYNPAVRSLRSMIESGELGDLRYIDAVRAGLGLFHPTLNVVWDLAPHDVAILLYLLGETPVSVSARGIACIQESVEDVAYITLMFPSGILAHTRMSWLDPHKIRKITVVASNKMVVYDDLELHEKLKVYDKRVRAIPRAATFGDFQFAYHYGGVVSPYIRFEEPLKLECEHFVECLIERKQPLTDAWNGVDVVRVIEAAQRSLQQGGIQIWLDEGARPASAAAETLSVAGSNVSGSEPILAAASTANRGNGGSLRARKSRSTRMPSSNGANPKEDEVVIDLTEEPVDERAAQAAEV